MSAHSESGHTSSPHVADVTRADFASNVVERSYEVPVLVDFWAPWCGPCRTLGPVLEKLAHEYAGKFFLAKVNTDEEQELAMEYGIRGIPAVKLFRDGQLATEFVGVQPEPAVRGLIDPFVPNETDALVARARAGARAGQPQEAIAQLRVALGENAHNDKAKIAIADLLLSERLSGSPLTQRVEEAQKLLDSLSLRVGASPDVERLRARLEFLRIVADAPSADELERELEKNPADHLSRYRLAARLALQGHYEQAMEQLLEIVRRDRKFNDDAARRTLLAVFNLIGSRDPLVIKYRGLLARAIN